VAGVVALIASAMTTGPGHAQAARPATAAADAAARGSVTGERYTETVPGTAVSFEMLAIPGGRVTLVTPDGDRTVEVGPFWMSQAEVTWDLYDVFVYGFDRDAGVAGAGAVARPSKPYVLPGAEFGHQGRPALAMTYHAATEFAKWLSAVTGKSYRLPTEAEWEYACRANAAEPRDELTEYAWFWENSEMRTRPGGQRKPNAFGLTDMLGNVAEWASGADGDPVVKGGSFRDDAEDVHCGARKKQTPAWNATDPQLPKSSWWLTDAPFVGLRLVRDP
jgi:formylglycine-generating enzyme required for sulfatase activity